MDNRIIIQRSIDYIEENLKTEITAQELSRMAGFSLFHYYRLFQSAVGMPVMQFIVRRKLFGAIYEIGCGKKIIDVALEYGFATYAGFYKAFVREFGYTPTQFLKMYPAQRPYSINLFQEEHIFMTHKKLSEVLTRWGLEKEKITDVFYEGSGSKNDNAFYIGNDYVMKLNVNLGNLNNHIGISKAIERVGLVAAPPVKTADGREFVEENGIYFCLTKRIQGRQVQICDLYDGQGETKARFIGEIIGQLSLALEQVDAVVNEVNLYEDVVTRAIPKARELVKLPDALYQDYLDTFGGLFEKLPKQIIHRDPNPGNIIMADKKWGVIDFELSEKNVRVFDPCYAATGILSESFAEDKQERLLQWITLYRNIVDGYDSVAKLSAEERRAIPYVVLSNQLLCVASFAEQEKYRDIFEINRKMTNWIIEHFEELRIA